MNLLLNNDMLLMCLKIVNSKLFKTFFNQRKMNFSKINRKKCTLFKYLKSKTAFLEIS